MRRERQPINEGAEAYTFHFQIAINGVRQARSVTVQAPNILEATTFLRQNWPLIESMAGEGQLDRPGDGRKIKLAVS